MDITKKKLKRVGILLRVSTKGQAYQTTGEEDIPTQRTLCMRFIDSHPDWVFEKEYLEIGISGFKNSIDDRDKLLEVKEDIRNRKIDVLVVFMLDRLGRIAKETPFVVQSFIEMGVEIWSVKEGQRRIDEHVDVLTNFITFWQASGESEKISERVTDSMALMAEAGKYTGGKPPFGYKTVPTGNMTKKKLPEKTLAIEENEAQTVRMIFNLTITHGYGCHRIAKHLNEQGITTRGGKQWNNSAISNILHNPIYKGTKAYNRTTAKGLKKGQQKRQPKENWIVAAFNPEWVIIPEKDWDEIQKKILSTEDRTKEQYESNQAIDDVQIGRTNLLFQGYAYCGCCGAKMQTGYSPYRWKTADGVSHRRSFALYKCGAKSSGKLGCNAKSSYRPDPIEGVVIEEVKHYLEMLKSIELTDEIMKVQKNSLALEETTIKNLKREQETLLKEKKSLESEVVKVIMGESSFNADMLNSLIETKTSALNDVNGKLEAALSMLERKKLEQSDLVQLKKMIPVWQDEFDKAPIEVKKVLLSKIIERVDIYKDKVEVTLRMHIQDFINGVEVREIPAKTNEKRKQIKYKGDVNDLTTNSIYRRPNRHR